MDALSSISPQAGYTMPKFHNRSSSLFPSTKNNKIFHEKEASGVQNIADNSAPLTCVGKPSKGQSSKTRIQSAQSRIEKTLQKRIDVNHSFLLSSNSGHLKKRPNSSGINRLRAPRPQSAASIKEKNNKKLDCHHVSSQPKSVELESSKITWCESSTDGNVPSEKIDSQKDSEQSTSLQEFEVKNEYKNIEMALVPIGGQPVPVIDVGCEAPVPTYHYQMPQSFKQLSSNNPKPFMPPSPADKVANSYGSCVKREESDSSTKSHIDEGLKPSVYGLDNNRQVYGGGGETQTTGYPYKLSTQDDLINEMKALTFHKQEIKERTLPESLEPLRPWLTESLSKDFTGVDPQSCLVFLPSLQDKDLSEIPEVPTPHDVEEEFPFKEKIPSQEVIGPKKYEHPSFNRKPVEDWVCKHSRPHTRIYTEDGQLLHDNATKRRFQGKRTAGVIRKEIEELENLLKGIGTKNSSCSVVNYQAEIADYRSLQQQVMAKIPDRLLHSPKPVDTFGLRQFYVEHDEVIQQISRQHALCVEELATLEEEIGIISDRKYFKHQVPKQPD